MTLRFDVVTLFPELVEAVTKWGVVQRAAAQGLIELELWNPRDFTIDRHNTVDDRPYGGGPGMVMLYEPLAATVKAIRAHTSRGDDKVVCMSPQGRVIEQAVIAELSTEATGVILICGRYEGIDERFIETFVDEEWSLGDFVVSGGEIPAMAIIDAATRLLPGALGHSESAQQDSFSDGLLDCPHYTRPEKIGTQSVPPVLLSGDHQKIAKWRADQALDRTQQRRPDLIKKDNEI